MSLNSISIVSSSDSTNILEPSTLAKTPLIFSLFRFRATFSPTDLLKLFIVESFLSIPGLPTSSL